MPRPIWNGSISFGLVNVPVRMFSAQSPKDVHFNQLHAPDNSRIRMKRCCEAENVEVPYDEIVKGYEIAPDQYVVVEPRELEEFDPKATHSIDIEEVVHLDQIDPIYFEDRKSTRLNSSHLVNSYAVFSLKKKIPALAL